MQLKKTNQNKKLIHCRAIQLQRCQLILNNAHSRFSKFLLHIDYLARLFIVQHWLVFIIYRSFHGN